MNRLTATSRLSRWSAERTVAMSELRRVYGTIPDEQKVIDRITKLDEQINSVIDELIKQGKQPAPKEQIVEPEPPADPLPVAPPVDDAPPVKPAPDAAVDSLLATPGESPRARSWGSVVKHALPPPFWAICCAILPRTSRMRSTLWTSSHRQTGVQGFLFAGDLVRGEVK